MAVDSVSSSTNAAFSPAAKSQLRTQPSEQDQQAQKAASDRARAEQEAAQSAQVEAAKSKPTVNANGQTVGSRVNTTA